MRRAKEFYYTRIALLCCVIFEAWFSVNQSFGNLTPQTKETVCFADWLINGYSNFQSDGVGLFIILMSLLILIRDDFRYSNLLQFQSRKELWDKQTARLCLHSTIYGICYSLCAYYFALKKSTVLCNWNETESYFFAVNKTIIKCKIEYIVIAFLVGVILNWIILGMISLLLHWIMRREAFVWLTIIFIKFTAAAILHTNLEVSLSYWRWVGKKIVPGIMGALVIVVLLYIIGRRIVPFKEFNAKDVE